MQGWVLILTQVQVSITWNSGTENDLNKQKGENAFSCHAAALFADNGSSIFGRKKAQERKTANYKKHTGEPPLLYL